jgi:hypothetical protein
LPAIAGNDFRRHSLSSFGVTRAAGLSLPGSERMIRTVAPVQKSEGASESTLPLSWWAARSTPIVSVTEKVWVVSAGALATRTKNSAIKAANAPRTMQPS